MKPATFPIVQYGGKDAGGIEPRQATPVDGAVDPYQSRSERVANDSIAANRLVSHFQLFSRLFDAIAQR